MLTFGRALTFRERLRIYREYWGMAFAAFFTLRRRLVKAQSLVGDEIVIKLKLDLSEPIEEGETHAD